MRRPFFSKLRHIAGKAFAAFTNRDHPYLIVMGAIAGTAGGYGAIGFRVLISFVSQSGWGYLSGAVEGGILGMAMAAPTWAKISIPAIGGILVGTIVHFFSKEAKGHGVPEVMEAMALREGRMRIRVVFAKAFASAISIGTGGSVGREGPIVQIGAAMGSAIGALVRMSAARLRILVACGAAAGIAATFNAPMAGAIFSLEIVLSEFAASQFIPIVVSSVTATAISRHHLGNFPAFEIPAYDIVNYSELLLYLILGVLAGVVAYAFIRVLYGMEDIFDRWRFPEFIKPAVGGILIGCIGIFFPQIFGVGYETVDQVLRGEMLGIMLLGLLIAKIVSTSITIGSGGSGGIFAPSLFMGAVLGGSFGQIVHNLFPYSTALPGAYALVGMGAVVAGTTRALITAIIIIFEMTANYQIILPLMFSCTIGLVISTYFSRESIYTIKLIRKGINIYAGRELNVLKNIKVSQVMLHEIELILPSASLSELATRMTTSSRSSQFFVVNDDNHIQGHISLENLRPIIKDYETVCDAIIASDVMDSEITVVNADESLDMVMQLFGKINIDEIPVLDKGRVIGTIRRGDVIEAYNREIFKQDMASSLSTSLRLQQKIQLKRFPLGDGFLILELTAPKIFIGKSLEALRLREAFGATVLTIKKQIGGDKTSYILPNPSSVIQENDVLVVFGLHKDLSDFPRD